MSTFEQIVLKIIARLVAFLGILLYLFMLSSAYIGWQHDQNIHESLLSELYYIMSLAIFGSGLPPILLVIYFLILGKTAKDFGMGFIFVFTFILVHFYVVGVSIHTEPIIHIPFQLVELAIVIGIMRYWHTQYRVPLNQSRLAQQRQNSEVE